MKDYNLKDIRKDFKEKGIFYTDAKLALRMKSYLPDNISEVYDPTCGNGSLLSVFGDDVKKYGQEINPSQAEEAKARLRNACIITGDTLISPAFIGKKFGAIMSNYPFSIKYDPAKIDPFDPRFMTLPCIAPPSKADYMFLAHILYYLDEGGTAVTLNFPGVLYRGAKEGKIREWIVRQNYVDEVVNIEGGHFIDTSISTAIIVLKKGRKNDDTVRFTDNPTGKYRDVPLHEIKDNDYNLSVSTYVETSDGERGKIDIDELEVRIMRIRARRMKIENELDDLLKELKNELITVL